MGTKILIVDDDSDIRRGLNVRLQANGYEVLFAADAISALSVAVKERPDLIILDIGLPAGDGYVVMERLQNYPALACVPVIILSHEAQPTTNNVHWRLGLRVFPKTGRHWPPAKKHSCGNGLSGSCQVALHNVSCCHKGGRGLKLRGAEEGTRTPTPLRVHGPEPCASANSATSASDCVAGRPVAVLMEETTQSILQRRQGVSNLSST